MFALRLFKESPCIRIQCNRTIADNSIQNRNLLKWKLKLTDNQIKRILKSSGISTLDPDQLSDTVDELMKKNFNPFEVSAYPHILLKPSFIINDHCHILAEVGFNDLTAYRLHHCKQIMNNSVRFNVSFYSTPKHKNILQNIFEVADLPNCWAFIQKFGINYKSTDSLYKIHKIATKIYLQHYLKLSDEEIARYMSSNIMKLRSIQGIRENAKLIEGSFEKPFSNNLYRYQFDMYPEQIRKLLNLEQVCGIDVRDLMTSAFVSSERYIRTMEIIKQYKIPNYVLRFCRRVFHLHPDTLATNLEIISQRVSDQNIFQHIGIGFLVVNINQLRSFMEKEEVDFDAAFNEDFIDFFLNGSIFRKAHYTRNYLSWVFDVTIDELEKTLQSHPHWRKIGFLTIYGNIEYLLGQGYTHADIYKDLYIVFYSLDEIKDCLQKLNDPNELKSLELKPEKLTKSHILRLCAYLIEKKCGFNGEGVFLKTKILEYDDVKSTKYEALIGPWIRKISTTQTKDVTDSWVDNTE